MISSTPPAKSVATESLVHLCDHRVSKVVTQEDLVQYGLSRQELAESVARILSRNLASGRAQRIMSIEVQGNHGDFSSLAWPPACSGQARGQAAPGHPDTSAQIQAYVDRVIACCLREHSRVESLAAKDDAEWRRLFEQLAGRAYSMLLRLQVPTGRAASEAADFAQATCEIIFCQRFPYDVSFDAWATLILKNQILRCHTRSLDLMDRQAQMQSLDRSETKDSFSLYDLLADLSSVSAFERTEVQECLVQAIVRLPSRAQQQVIIDTFFYELSDEEIARRLDKTRQAVYNLRHRALRRLKQILER